MKTNNDTLNSLISLEFENLAKNKNLYNFQLFGNTTYSDVIEKSKQLEPTKESIKELMSLDLDFHLDFSFIPPPPHSLKKVGGINNINNVDPEEEDFHSLSLKYDNFDSDLINSILTLNKLNDGQAEPNLQYIKQMIEDEDTITKNFLESARMKELINKEGNNNNNKDFSLDGKSDSMKPKNSSTEIIINKDEKILDFFERLDQKNNTNENLKNKKLKNKKYKNYKNKKNKKGIYDDFEYLIDSYLNNKIRLNILKGDIKETLHEKIKTKMDRNMDKITVYKIINIINTTNTINNTLNSIISNYVFFDLYIGTMSGAIYKYNFIAENEAISANTFPSPFKESKDKEMANCVLCIDALDNILIGGYKNGKVVIWRKDKQIDCIEYIKNNANSNDKISNNLKGIICLKIMKIKGKKIEYISSDISGNVVLTKRIESLFSPKITHEYIYENLEFPFYMIDFMEYKMDNNDINNSNNENDNLVDNININLENNENDDQTLKLKNIFLLLSSINEVKIIKIKPKIKEIYTYQKPNFSSLENDNIFIPDFCHGRGYLPKLKDTVYKKIYENDPKFSLSNIPNDIFDLLLISWGNEILIFCIYLTPPPNQKKQLILICRYIHEKSIIKIGFLYTSFIYIVDKEEITIKNTKFLNNESIILDENQFSKVEIQKIKLINQKREIINLSPPLKLEGEKDFFLETDFDESFDTDILSEIFNGCENIPKKNFLGKIFTVNKGIVFFNSSRIKYLYLNEWETIFDNLSQEDLWEKLLCIGVEILVNKNNYFLPLEINLDNFKNSKNLNNLNIQESPLIEKYKELLNIFLYSILNSPPRDQGPRYDFLIEFCLKLNLSSFFFKNLYEIVQVKQQSEQFLSRLEKYILRGCFLKSTDIPEKMISEIINYNLNLKNLKGKVYLSNLLLNFPSYALSNTSLRQNVIDNDLITVYIYLYMYCPDIEDYYRPLEIISSIMPQKKESDNYLSFILTRDTELFCDEILSCRQYFLHRLLWYSNFCLNGVKYPHYDNMDEDKSIEVVAKIFLFLVCKCNILIYFDSFTFFQIINRFFLEGNLFIIICDICENYTKYDFFIETLNYDYDITINSDMVNTTKGLTNFIQILISTSKEIKDNFFILKDLYDFLTTICEKNIRQYITLEKNELLSIIEFYLKYNLNKCSVYHDPFQCHQNIFLDSDQEKDLIETKIIAIIRYLNDDLTKDIINDMLQKYEIGLFNNVKILLLNLTKNYNESFELQLRKINKNNVESSQIESIFNYINDTLLELKNKNDKEGEESFRETVLNHLPDLSEISLDDVTDLVDNWFSDEQEKIISKLSISPTLQLKYVQNFIKVHAKGKKSDEENEGDELGRNMVSNYSNFSNDRGKFSFKGTGGFKAEAYHRKSVNISSFMENNRDIDNNYNTYNNYNNYNYNERNNEEISTGNESNSDSNRGEDKYDNNDKYWSDDSSLLVKESIRKVSKTSLTRVYEEKMYSYYILEIKLLCHLNLQEDVFEIVRKNPRICNEEVLKILLENNFYDSAIYVYRAIGGYEEGIDLVKKVLSQNYTKLLSNLKSDTFKEKKNELLLEKHGIYLELGLSICERLSESQKLTQKSYDENRDNTLYLNDLSEDNDTISAWLKILEVLYQTKQNIKSYIKQNSNNDKTYFYTKINSTISFCIELTLTKMCEYIKLPGIIKIVTEKIKNVSIDFREFKKLLLGVIFSFNQMENILKIVKIILHKNILNEKNKFEFTNNSGLQFLIGNGCDLCKKSLKIDNKIYFVFKCGHCYHECCTYKDGNEHFCIICKRKEIEKNVTTAREYIQVIRENERQIINEKENENENNFEEKKKWKKKNEEDMVFFNLHKNNVSLEHLGGVRKMMKRTSMFIAEGELLNNL